MVGERQSTANGGDVARNRREWARLARSWPKRSGAAPRRGLRVGGADIVRPEDSRGEPRLAELVFGVVGAALGASAFGRQVLKAIAAPRANHAAGSADVDGEFAVPACEPNDWQDRDDHSRGDENQNASGEEAASGALNRTDVQHGGERESNGVRREQRRENSQTSNDDEAG